jgi:thioredoxin-dependent peroxiredoxin
MKQPAEGEAAPAFAAKDETGKTWKLADLKGKPVVLYFYPKDDTPGCTTQACGIRDHYTEFQKLGAVVLGVSRDNAESHQKFKQKFHLNFPLLVDEGSLSESYGTWVQKQNYGRTYWGVQRSTFVIGPDGVIVKMWPKVKPEEHTQDVLAVLKQIAPKAKR